MKIHQTIDLGPAWATIQLKYREIYGNRTGTSDHVLSFVDNIWLAEQLAEPLAALGYINKLIVSSLVFAQDPGDVQKIHIDGRTLQRTHTPNYALNIPILGCGTMIWYTGEYETYIHTTDAGLKGFGIKWANEKTVLEKTLIDRPCIVKVDIPHQVIADASGRRVMLSVRYMPDLVKQ